MLGVFPDEHRLAVGGVLGFHRAVHGDGNFSVGAGKLPRRVAAFPAVGQFYLIAVFKFLLKQTIFVVDTVAKPGNAERGHGVEIAGGQSAQTAVAERGVVFGVKNLFQRVPRPAVYFDVFQNIEQPQIAQVVFERTPDEIFDGEIIYPFGVGLVVAGNRLIHAIHGKLAHGHGNNLESLFFADFAGAFADKIFDVVLNRKLQSGLVDFAEHGRIVHCHFFSCFCLNISALFQHRRQLFEISLTSGRKYCKNRFRQHFGFDFAAQYFIAFVKKSNIIACSKS